MKSPYIAVTALAAALLTLGSCGVRYYAATVSGYVKSAAVAADGTQAGINGAEVLIYTVDPATDTTATPLARTGSMTSGGNDGYWNHKIMWTASSPLFADEGDSGTVWVKIMRKGYFPKTAKVSGILSDASNVVPTIEMTAIVSSELKGKVVNRNGVGVDGVTVVLDLMSTPDTESDFTATTATVDGEVGVFLFTDIAWEDADSMPRQPRAIGADGKATETYKLYIDDANWYSDANNAKGKAAQTSQTITSDAKLDIRSLPITVRSTTFTVPLVKGRVVDKADTAKGVNGVTIAVDLPITVNTSPDATVVTATLNGEDGWFQFENISWTNRNPEHSAAGLYDDKTTARIYLSDTARYSVNDADNPISIDLVSEAATGLPAGTTIAAGNAQFTVPSVKGRVILKDTTTGRNDVAVRLQLASGGGQTIGTTTSTVGSVDGVFEFKDVTWTDTKPTAGTGGALDTEQARIYVQDNNYSSDNSSTSPMIVTLAAAGSADISSTPLSVQMRNFTCPKVTGSVVTRDDNGVIDGHIAGVQVVLDLQSTANTTQDATATTDKDGVFVFNNVGWSDATPETSSSSDKEDIKLTLNDANYETVTAIALQQLISDTPVGGPSDTAWTITAKRTTRWNYSVTLAGNCVYNNTSPRDPTKDVTLDGVEVKITSIDSQGGGLETNAAPVTVQTAANGSYTATITWSRDPGYQPVADARANGGDQIEVKVEFSHTRYTIPMVASYMVLSWSGNNRVNGFSNAP